MLEYVGAVVSALAGLGAVFGFVLGVSRSSRLRRREQLLREALAVLPSDHLSREISGELHRAALAELVARQLTSPWRVAWPWGAWLLVVTLAAQSGFLVSGYLAAEDRWSVYRLLLHVFGDPGVMIATVPLVLVGLPLVTGSYLNTVTRRAAAARRFYDGQSIERPRPYMWAVAEEDVLASASPSQRPPEAERRYEPATADHLAVVKAYVFSLVPGLAAMSFGLFLGLMLWSGRQTEQAPLASLGSWPAWVAIGVAASGTALVSAVRVFRLQVRRYDLPDVFPASCLPLPAEPVARSGGGAESPSADRNVRRTGDKDHGSSEDELPLPSEDRET